MEVQTKTVVTISEMARMCGLSRARFYQLIGTKFPWPLYDVSTRRPFYVEEIQKACLHVRRRNCGIDGKPILFYARRPSPTLPAKPRGKKPNSKYAALLDGLKGLGLSSVTIQQVESAMTKLYPNGTAGVSDTDTLRQVFLSIKAKNSGDKLG